jgi:post-GPI attachment to proteins factor 3
MSGDIEVIKSINLRCWHICRGKCDKEIRETKHRLHVAFSHTSLTRRPQQPRHCLRHPFSTHRKASQRNRLYNFSIEIPNFDHSTFPTFTFEQDPLVDKSALMREKLFCLICWFLWREVTSSSGDRDRNYAYCVKSCYHHRENLEMTLTRIIFVWDDLDECKYQCMRQISDEREAIGLSVHKYYGHWPYHRLYGLQEPAAAIFSLGNIIPHFYHLLFSRQRFTHPHYYMSQWIILNGCLASLAWLCSTIFHMRKIDLTINLDYMSALIFLFHGFWLALRRTLHSLLFKKYPFLSYLLFPLLSIVCLTRLSQMASGGISFDHHMELCIFLAVSQCALWCLWCFFSSRSSASSRYFCLFLQLWFALAALLELYDFPPLATHFDAHSLWHAATIPLGFLWYLFWERDLKETMAREGETRKDE